MRVDVGGSIPFSIGGGNDQSFASYLAYRRLHPTRTSPEIFLPSTLFRFWTSHSGRLAVINIDAHLDVRPLVDGRAHSGSPFRYPGAPLYGLNYRQMITSANYSGVYVVFAAQGSQCSVDHSKFIADHGGRIVWLSSIRV